MSHTATLPAGELRLPSPTGRLPGGAIALAAVASTIAVALDGNAGGHTPQEILASIGQLQNLKAVVHGIAIAATCIYAYGYATLARRLGLQRPAVLAGLVAYLFGCAALLGATILDGFVTPHVALDGAAATAPERVRFAFDMVHYLGIVLTDFAKLGWVLQAVGSLAWSAALLRTPNGRWVGGVGLLSSLLMLGAVLGSSVYMSMAAILAILVSQLLWNLAAATWLIRRPADAAE
jgi:hypothetical protein